MVDWKRKRKRSEVRGQSSALNDGGAEDDAADAIQAPRPAMGLGASAIRRTKDDTVPAVADAGHPARDLAGAEVMPLQTTQGISLFAREVLEFDFRQLAQAIGQIRHAPFTLHALRSKAHFPAPFRG